MPAAAHPLLGVRHHCEKADALRAGQTVAPRWRQGTNCSKRFNPQP